MSTRFDDFKDTTIFSIWPLPLKERRIFLEPQKDFSIPAGSPENIQRLVVEAQVEIIREFSDKPPRREHMSSIVLAEDLMNAFARSKAYIGMEADAGPGIWINREMDSLSDKEIRSGTIFKDMCRRQDAYFKGIVEEARHLSRQKDGHLSIATIHHTAARYLNLKNEPWQEDLSHDSSKDCIVCMKPIPRKAMRCSYCQAIVDPVAYALYVEETAKEMAKYGLNPHGGQIAVEAQHKPARA